MTTWIESHQDLRTNPKAKRLARLLGIPLAQAIGHLHMLWWWAVDHARDDGDVTGFDAYDIADAAGWEGDEKAFLDALHSCGPGDRAGFLEPVDNGRTVLHDWSDYTMALRASREGSARGNHVRWHAQRGITDPSCRFCASPPESPPSRPGHPPRVAPDVPPESRGDSSRAHTREESTDLPTYRPTDLTPRAHAHDDPPAPPDQTPQAGENNQPPINPDDLYGQQTIGRLPPRVLRAIHADDPPAIKAMHRALTDALHAGIPPAAVRQALDGPPPLDTAQTKSVAATAASRIRNLIEEAASA